MALVNRRTDISAFTLFYDLSSSIDKLSFKSNNLSLGLVVLEKLFMRKCMQMPQSDAIMSAD